MLTPRWCLYCILIVVLQLSAACSADAADSVLASEKSEELLSPETQVTESRSILTTSTSSTTPLVVDHTPAVPLSEILSAHTNLLQTAASMRDGCVSTVFNASIQNGSALTLVGTLSFDTSGTSAYDPTPTDRLHVREADGMEADLIITQFEGNNFENAQSFLTHDHNIDCLWRNEMFDLQIASVQVGKQNQQTINGWVFYANYRLTADLMTETHEQFNVDGEAHQVYSVVNGSTTVDHVVIAVREETEYRLLNTSQQVKQAFSLAWVQGDDRYQLQDGYVQYTLRAGLPVEPDFWRAQGTLLKNTGSYGEISLQSTTGTFQMVLVGPQETIVLREW